VIPLEEMDSFLSCSERSLVDYFHWTYFFSYASKSFPIFPPKVCISREYFLSSYSLLFMRCVILLNKGHKIIFCSLSFACTHLLQRTPAMYVTCDDSFRGLVEVESAIGRTVTGWKQSECSCSWGRDRKSFEVLIVP